MLGKPLDKSMQVSDWEARPLTERQIRYAALDAHAVLALHDAFQAALQPGPYQRLVAAKSYTYTANNSGGQRRQRRVSRDGGDGDGDGAGGSSGGGASSSNGLLSSSAGAALDSAADAAAAATVRAECSKGASTSGSSFAASEAALLGSPPPPPGVPLPVWQCLCSHGLTQAFNALPPQQRPGALASATAVAAAALAAATPAAAAAACMQRGGAHGDVCVKHRGFDKTNHNMPQNGPNYYKAHTCPHDYSSPVRSA